MRHPYSFALLLILGPVLLSPSCPAIAATVPDGKARAKSKAPSGPMISPRMPGATPKALAVAAGDADPSVITWIDSEDDSVGLDQTIAAKVHDLFARALWVMVDSGDLVFGHVKGEELEPFLVATYLRNKENTFFLVHARIEDRTVHINGTVYRSSGEPGQGMGELFIVQLQEDGKVAVSSYVQQKLAFSKKLTALGSKYIDRPEKGGRSDRRFGATSPRLGAFLLGRKSAAQR